MSGTVQATANVFDNVGAVGVQSYLDGVTPGAEDTAAPYSVSWDTTKTANGSHALTIRADAEYFNLDAIRFEVNQIPYGALPLQVPGQIEAEDFDRGGEGIAYHDLLAGNQGGLYRTTEDVDIISPYVGGYAVNNFQTGEWLEYTINVPLAGIYSLQALLSSAYATIARFHFEVDGADVTGLIDAPNTGSWWTYQWVGKAGISLAAGQHVLRIYANAEYFNLDAIRIMP